MSTYKCLGQAGGADMTDDLANIQYKPIWSFNYSQWFQEVQYEDKTLSDAERRDFVEYLDQTIERHLEGIPLMREALEAARDQHDEYHELERSVVSIMFFVLITMIDSLVASKFFLLADKDYERRFMRGKLMVILNEGFKRLYGFGTNKSEWARLKPWMKNFPAVVQSQYRELSALLNNDANSSWWKNERDYEVHLEVEKLYASRQEDVVESKVMRDMMKLFTRLQAVNEFLSNVHTCLYNYLVGKYKRGELIEE